MFFGQVRSEKKEKGFFLHLTSREELSLTLSPKDTVVAQWFARAAPYPVGVVSL